MSKTTLSDDTRLDILAVLDQLMREHPSWRIGQLVANMAFLARQTETAAWDVENEEFVQAAKRHLQRIAEHKEAAAQAKQDLSKLRQKAAV